MSNKKRIGEDIMDSIVTDLENDIVNNKDILSILNKALIISNDLNLSEFNSWIKCEINGYGNVKDLPDYRIIGCEIYYDLPHRRKNNLGGHPDIIKILNAIPEKDRWDLVNYKMKKPISTIVHICENDKDIAFGLNNYHVDIIKEYIPNMVRIYGLCSIYEIKSIIDRVKPEILRWCGELKNKNIYGVNNNFTEEELESAKTITNNYLIINNSHIQLGNNYYEINNFSYLKRDILNILNEFEINLNQNELNENIEIKKNIGIVKEELEKEKCNFSIMEKALIVVKEVISESIGITSASLLLYFINQALTLIFAQHTLLLLP